MRWSSTWFKHGFLNTLEHTITRGFDAAASLVLLWALSPEIFARLASSQALIAPVLIIFIAPETVLYRDYALWRSEGASNLAARISALRTFALGKAQLALLLSALLALIPTQGAGWADHFWALLWAFSLVLAPQISGPDREFLRLDLKLKDLNAISLYQKLSLLIGTCVVALSFPSHLELLAAVAVFSALSTFFLAWRRVTRLLRAEGASEQAIRGKDGPSVLQTLKDAIQGFSIWQHGIGVVLGWVQTMDLFFLSFFALSAREVGLYAAALKLANFSTMLPLALSNLFSIWVGRRVAESGHQREKKAILDLTWILAAGVSVQALVIYLISPWVFHFLSHGRWTQDEQTLMQTWLAWILGGSALFSFTFLVVPWLSLRTQISRLFSQVYLPWAALSVLVYSFAVYFGEPSGAFLRAAMANVGVSSVYIVLLLIYLKKRAS